jgi:hypothetical protein
MNLWDYVFTPGAPSLGPVAMLTLIASAFVALGGIALVVVPKELAHWSAMRSTRHVRAEHSEAGPKERELRAELRVKVGAGISAWSGALILSLLLRLLGTRGLETRFLPTLVILALPLLAGYIVVYRLFFYPRYLAVGRRIDANTAYDRVAKKSKKAGKRAPGREKISLLPVKAMLASLLVPITYYLLMVPVSIPAGVPPQNHDHLLHQSGMLVMALLGYAFGLAVSLGEELRPMAAWLKVRQGKSGAH